MGLHEECGVFGVFADKPINVAGIAYYGLYALQHRGQESCGIVVNDDGVFASYKDLGLVGEVFSPEVLSRFPAGTMAVGHTRYGTTGATNRNNCQPIEVNHQKGRMALAHNGNLSNASELRSELELSGAIFHTTSDTETIAYIITRERLRTTSIENALSRAMDTLDGKFYCVEADRLDDYSYSCGFILIDDSNVDLDTLERPSCTGNVSESVSFVAHYLKVNGDFYEIRKGKFVSQEPAYRMLEEHGNLKFLDNDDNFVMYSGKP